MATKATAQSINHQATGTNRRMALRVLLNAGKNLSGCFTLGSVLKHALAFPTTTAIDLKSRLV